MQVSIRSCLIAIIALIAPTVASADFEIFNQINNPGQTYTFSGKTTTLSQFDTTPGLPVGVSPELATTYDDFTLANNGKIDQIQWTGSYDPSGPGLGASAFRIAFYQDNAGVYGAQIGPTIAASIGSVAETADGGHFRYTYTPVSSLFFSGGTKYWMSVVAALDYGDDGLPTPTSNSWGWAFNGANPGSSMQDFSGTIFTDPINHSFRLTTTVVPEPSSCLLLAGAVGGLAVRKWRKRRTVAA